MAMLRMSAERISLASGPEVGAAIAAHPDVDMVSFTGSTRAGKAVAAAAAGTVKRVALELGGKSANIVLDDADFTDVIPKGVFACYLNSGQTCTAHTRMLVPRSRYDEAVAVAVRVPGAEAEVKAAGVPEVGARAVGEHEGEVQRGEPPRSLGRSSLTAGHCCMRCPGVCHGFW